MSRVTRSLPTAAALAAAVAVAAAPQGAWAAVSVSVTSTPLAALQAGTVTVTVTGTDPAARFLVAGVRPDDGRACAADLGAEQAAAGTAWRTLVNATAGEGPRQVPLTPQTGGAHRVCAYVTGATALVTVARADVVLPVDPGVLTQGDCPAVVPRAAPAGVVVPPRVYAGRPFEVSYEQGGIEAVSTTGPPGAVLSDRGDAFTARVAVPGAAAFTLLLRPPSAVCVQRHPFTVAVLPTRPLTVSTSFTSKALGRAGPGFAALERPSYAFRFAWDCGDAIGPSPVSAEPVTLTVRVARGLAAPPRGPARTFALGDPCGPVGPGTGVTGGLPAGVRVGWLRSAKAPAGRPVEGRGGVTLLHGTTPAYVTATLAQGRRTVASVVYAYAHVNQSGPRRKAGMAYSPQALLTDRCGSLAARRASFLNRPRLPPCPR